jgi:hypothetical protein
MSLEMAKKVIVPQKKIMSRSFLNSGTLIVIFSRIFACCSRLTEQSAHFKTTVPSGLATY